MGAGVQKPRRAHEAAATVAAPPNRRAHGRRSKRRRRHSLYRDPWTRAGRAAALLVAAIVVTGLAPAYAQTEALPETQPERRPVIDAAPWRVGFDRNARIRGHLRNGEAGDTVAVQRRDPNRAWRVVARKRVDSEARVSFLLRDRRRTARYRLLYRDKIQETSTVSDGVRIAVRPRLRFRIGPRHAMSGASVRVSGRLAPVVPGRRVVVQKRIDGQWRRVANPYAGDGTFAARVRVRGQGRKGIRVRFGGDRISTGRAALRKMRVYGPSVATWYGPGFYGNRTACGPRLTRDTLGVAHRKLPCGTRVNILYRGRTIAVPVIDRGPYSSANWDLTSRTAGRLNFSGRGTIGVDP